MVFPLKTFYDLFTSFAKMNRYDCTKVKRRCGLVNLGDVVADLHEFHNLVEEEISILYTASCHFTFYAKF